MSSESPSLGAHDVPSLLGAVIPYSLLASNRCVAPRRLVALHHCFLPPLGISCQVTDIERQLHHGATGDYAAAHYFAMG